LLQQDAPFCREEITSYLENAGVETRPIVAGNLARHPAAARFPAFQGRTFTGADLVHKRGFYIGLSPVQTDSIMDRLTSVFDKFLASY
jgi:CDP-4-dehydro-6-deoxyglucose reductase, E1